jgi:hypothetical protein
MEELGKNRRAEHTKTAQAAKKTADSLLVLVTPFKICIIINRKSQIKIHLIHPIHQNNELVEHFVHRAPSLSNSEVVVS